MLRSAVTTILCFTLLLSIPANAQQLDATAKLLQELSEAPGPGGFEGPVIKIVKRELESIVKNFTIDAMGNVMGELPGPPGSPRILVQAHMDEVGFLVRNITPDGFILFNPTGGWLPQVILEQRWRIDTARGPVYGVTGMKSPHITSAEERNVMVQQENMFIDIGAKTAEDAREMGLRPGLPIVPDSEFKLMSNSKMYMGKAWDDRAGIGVMIDAVKQLAKMNHPNTVIAAATVQEEVGLRGAHAVALTTKPDLVLNLEIGIAGDYPFTTPKIAQERLGGGPAIFVFENSMIPNNSLIEYIIEFARRNKIPIQFSSISGYGQDASVTQRFGPGGVLAVNIGIPGRYAHSHTGIIHRDDYDNTVKLIVGLVQQLTAADIKKLREW